MAEIKRVLQENVEQDGWLGRIVEMTDGKKVFLRGRKIDGGGGDSGGGGSSSSSGGGSGVSSNLADAYARAQKGERFEGDEREGGKDARARAQLEWEKTEDGKKWLADNGYDVGEAGHSQGAVMPAKTMAFKESEAYKSLNQEQKDFIEIAFNTLHTGGESEAVKLANAINSAYAIADPYYKAQLGLSKAEIISTIARNTGNFAFAEEALKRTRDELLEDIALNSEELTLEEQADIARVTRQFEDDILNIQDAAANKGVTFGTGRGSRQEAEGRATEEYEDVVQSTQRRANFQRTRLGLAAGRAEVATAQELAKGKFNQGIDLRNILRESERLLGSEGATDIAEETGINTGSIVGGVRGTLTENKERDIISDIGGFLELQRAFL